MNKVDQIIQQLKDIDVDGETMQHILEQVGMDDQMHRQLVMSKPIKSTKELLEEKEELNKIWSNFSPPTKINLEDWKTLLIFVSSNQYKMNKAEQFLQLQAEVNEQIDEQGQASEQLADQLEALGNELNEQEIEEVCERARAERLYEQGLRHY